MKATYANQKAIVINRTLPKKGERKKFLSAYYDSITLAARTLSGEVAFKLYLYLLSNQDQYVDNFSPANFSADFGTSADRTRKVFEQLEAAGYLERIDSNTYKFYEVPQKRANFANFSSQERRKIENEDGTYQYMTYLEFYSAAKSQMDWPDITIQENWERSEVEQDGLQKSL